MLPSIHTFRFYQSLVAKRILENKDLSLTVVRNRDILDDLKKRRIDIAKRHSDLTGRMNDAKKRSDELLHRPG